MTETIGDRHGSATGSIALADVISRQEGYEKAKPIFARAKSLYAEFGDRWGKAFALDSEGLAAARSGDLEVARMLHEEAIGVSREIGDERGVARSILHLADEAAREGDLTRAKALNRECLRIRRTLRDMPGTATALERLASVVMAERPRTRLTCWAWPRTCARRSTRRCRPARAPTTSVASSGWPRAWDPRRSKSPGAKAKPRHGRAVARISAARGGESEPASAGRLLPFLHLDDFVGEQAVCLRWTAAPARASGPSNRQ